MDGEPGSTSPTTADVAEGMGIVNEEPPSDEPLALVKKVKIKAEPNWEDDEKPMDLAMTGTRKNPISETSVVTTANVAVNVPQNLIYTYSNNGVKPTVPDLVDIIPTAVNGKAVRPFKAYNANREILTGLPTVSYPSAVPVALSGPTGAAVPLSIPTVVVSSNSVTSSNGGPNAHLMTLATEADRLSQRTGETKVENGFFKTESDEAMTPGSTSGGSDTGSSGAGDLLEETIEKIKKRAAGLGSAKTEPSATGAGMVLGPIDSPPPKHTSKKSKKSKNPPSEPARDNHYWERRRKNNEAAKRSRDARRAKEDQIAIRAALLEQENMRLRIEVAALKEETVKLRAMLYNKK